MDHSKYRNLKKIPPLRCRDGIDLEGVHYTIVPCLFASGIFQDEDCTGLSDFELSDTTDDAEEHIDSTDSSISASISLDDDSTEEVDRREVDRRPRCRKRGYDFHSIAASHMRIKREKRTDCYKSKQIKKEKNDDDYTSDNSIQSLEYFKRKKSRQSTPIPLCQSYNEVVEVKDESGQSPKLFGYHFCEVCNLDMSSEKVYNDHMNGKRHRKNLKLKHVDLAVIQAMPLFAGTEGQSRYPKPPHGVIRKKVKQRAKIQDVIKAEVKKPCPGLNLVTEIQGLKETQYYCSICNSICSPSSIISHLTGFKHQLNSVKYFRPGDYEYIGSERKNLVQDRIIGILRAIQKREGLGRMTVEVEELASDSNDLAYEVSRPSTSRELQVTSLKSSGMSFTEYYDKATIPDKSAADFYCEYCDAHMNSEDMWNSHITGKRHITNLKKMPGDRPSKTKTIPLLNARAKLLDRIEEECNNEPVVGLNEIREVQIRETNSESYNCFLCCSCHTSMDIVEHIVSLKHRKKFLDHIEYAYMQYISGMSEMSSIPIIKSICAEIEEKNGRGKPSVHINKSAFFG